MTDTTSDRPTTETERHPRPQGGGPRGNQGFTREASAAKRYAGAKRGIKRAWRGGESVPRPIGR